MPRTARSSAHASCSRQIEAANSCILRPRRCNSRHTILPPSVGLGGQHNQADRTERAALRRQRLLRRPSRMLGRRRCPVEREQQLEPESCSARSAPSLSNVASVRWARTILSTPQWWPSPRRFQSTAWRLNRSTMADCQPPMPRWSEGSWQWRQRRGSLIVAFFASTISVLWPFSAPVQNYSRSQTVASVGVSLDVTESRRERMPRPSQ